MKSTTDPWDTIVNTANLADKPADVSVLGWLTDLKQRQLGERRTLKAAILAKIDAHEAAQRAKHARATASAITASAIRPTSPPRPAPPPASRTPHLDTLAKLSGDAATLYFRQHRREILAEDMQRKASIASAQLRENCRAAKAGRGFNS
jgi:cell division septum initiation protein DivIVA